MSAVSDRLVLKNIAETPCRRGKKANPWGDKIDRLAKLDELLEPYDALQEERERIRKELTGEFSDQGDPEGDILIQGTAHCLTFGPRAKIRKVINLRVLQKVMGAIAFLKCVKPVFSEIDKVLTIEEQEGLVSTELGNRRIKSIRPIRPELH